MMIYLHIRHTVMNYARWKEGFDIHLAARQAGGSTQEVCVMRNVDNPQEIIVVLGWDDLATASAFANSVSLQTAMEEMGVVGEAEVRILEGLCRNW